MSWKTFLAAHAGAIAAADFFSVEVLTRGGLVRYMVMFVIDLHSRRVEIAGIAAAPHGAWMAQIVRNLTDAVDGFLNGKRYLIVDRDPLFTAHFTALLRTTGVELLRLPARSPNLNAYAERFVRSIKSECLAKVIPLGEAHLRTLVREYVEHYHEERNHQGIGKVIPFPRDAPRRDGRVRRRDRVGGLLRTTIATRHSLIAWFCEPPRFGTLRVVLRTESLQATLGHSTSLGVLFVGDERS